MTARLIHQKTPILMILMNKIKWKYFLLLIILLNFQLFFSSCNRRIPSVIYKEKIVTLFDTVTVQTLKTDTIPCADFDISLLTELRDTVYVKVVDKQLSLKYIKRTDTVYKETIIVQPAQLRVINRTRIDNSVKVKAKNGSAIGDGNKITTKKNNWWWIFLAGALSWLIIQNVLFRTLKIYFPFLKFLP